MYDIPQERINRRTFIKRMTLTGAGIAITPAVLAACGESTSTSSEDVLTQARKAGFIRVSNHASIKNVEQVVSPMYPVGPCIGAIASIQRPPRSHGMVES